MIDKEFEDHVRKITQIMDNDGKTAYGLCLIGHEKSRIDSDGQLSVKHISPDVSDRCAKIINRMVDLTAYIGIERGVRYIYPRQINIEEGKQITEIYAGSHFSTLNDKIDLNYDSLVNAIAEAMSNGINGKKVALSDSPIQIQVEQKIDFKAVKSGIGKIVKALSALDESSNSSHYMEDYKSIVEKFLGKNKLVKDCTPAQAEHLLGVYEELQVYVKDNNIEI